MTSIPLGRLIELMRGGEYEHMIPEIEQQSFGHLTNNQRALIAVDISHHRPYPGSSSNLPTQRQILESIGVSQGSGARAVLLHRYAITELRDLVFRDDRVGLTTAARIAELSSDDQNEFVARVRSGVEPRLAGSPKAHKRTLRTNRQPGSNRSEKVQRAERRDARYRYVQASTIGVFANQLDGLATVLAGSEGLDPHITPRQASEWRRDLSRRSKAFRTLMTLLKERSG